MSFKVLGRLLAAGAAACAGYFIYQKVKKNQTEEPEEEEEKVPEKDEAGNVKVEIEIPGMLTKINVKPGDHVSAGDEVAIIGNNLPLEAPVSGTVEEVLLEADRMVNMGDVLLTVKPD